MKVLYCAIALSTLSLSIGRAAGGEVPKDEVIKTVQMLEGMHYLDNRKFGDARGNEALEIFLESLDPGKYYFSKGDVQGILGEYRNNIDDMVKRGDLRVASVIYDKFLARVRERSEVGRLKLEEIGSFGDKTAVTVRGRKSEWAEEEQIPLIWGERMQGELVRELLKDVDIEAAKTNIEKRRAQFLKDIEDERPKAGQMLLSAVCQSYDPHTDYLGAEGMAEFDISMELQLSGIGVVLSQDNGTVKVESIVPGGPAGRDGRLRKGDQIVGVGGEDMVEDVSSLRIDKIVKKIRGKRGTLVTLDILRDGDGRKTVTLTRDDVQLNSQAARGAVVDSGGTLIGVITIPSFYYDGKGRSVSHDVRSLVKMMVGLGAEGLVIDLRQDGGGSLEESIRTAGLFVPGGTVVQIRDGRGGVDIRKAPAGNRAWDGPLLVLVDRNSASASEIFAGAIKDHRAGILAGDSRTFGKGTVQALMGLSAGGLMKFIAPERGRGGHLKLTIQKFYRANGESTQGKGVSSDIKISSITDIADIGEGDLPNSIPHSRMSPSELLKGPVTSQLVDNLRRKSEKRTAAAEIFADIESRIADIDRARTSGRMPLFDKRKEEIKNTFLATPVRILTTLRGGGIDLAEGSLSELYDGHRIPTMGGEESDPVLEEVVSIVSDWRGWGEDRLAAGREDNNKTN